MFIIPPDLFEESKPSILVEILYCKEREIASKHFIKKFEAFTYHNYRIAIQWLRKVKSPFRVESKNLHPSFKTWGKCLSGEEYTGETERNAEKRWSGDNNPTEKTKPARQLPSNISPLLAQKILMPAPKDKQTYKKFEAFFNAVRKWSLNKWSWIFYTFFEKTTHEARF